MSLSCTSLMTMTAPAWRCMWRGRGLALDRLLPDALEVPALAPDALSKRVPYTVQVPGETERYKLDATDKSVVLDAADFVVGFLAEGVPVQVLETDRASFLPKNASKLAVQSVGGEQD